MEVNGNIFQIGYVPQKNESHASLEQHENNDFFFSFLGGLSIQFPGLVF